MTARGGAVLACLLALLGSGACGDSGSDADAVDMRVDDDAAMDTTPAGTPAPPTLPSLAEDQERQAAVTLSEWAVASDHPQLPPGEITLQVTNIGIEPHALAVGDADQIITRTEELEPGQVHTLAVELAPGTYRLFCPDSVGGGAHADRGMSTALVIR